MDSVSNPYFPGAGSPPAALVGRDAQIREWEAGISRTANGNTAQPIVLHGLRGVGKTVLLTRFAEIAEERGWLVAELEAEPGRPLREALGEALHEPLLRLARPSAGQRVLRALKTALSFKASYDTTGTWSFGLDLSQAVGGGADTGRIETDLERVILDVAAAAADNRGGLAIVIDEAQDLGTVELAALSKVAQAASRRNRQVVMALAGLPSLPRVLGESKSYTERFNYQSIDALDETSAAAAVEQPASRHGVTWEPEAVDLLVTRTAAYPYFLQQFGHDTWDLASGSPITLADARAGAERATAKLDNGFFKVRWERATKSEQQYLRAIAIDADRGSFSSAIATRLGRTLQSLGPVRAQLIAKGLIYAPDHGEVAFTVPGMAAYIDRVTSD